MSLIDRYVAEVGRHLPEKDSSDIETEIRTMIEDTLDKRGQCEKVVADALEEIWNFWLPVFFVIMGLTLVHEVFKLKIGNYIAALATTQDVINPEFLARLDRTTSSALRETLRWSVGIGAVSMTGIYVWSMIDFIRKSRQIK